jgi:CBS domain-containing protein
LELKGGADMNIVRELLANKIGDVWSIGPKATVYEALTLMGEKEVGALMVMDGGKVAGIISERDYARKVALRGKTARETIVDEIMTPAAEMHRVKPDTTIADCMVVITGKRVRHLPVFDGNRVVGLVSIGDVLKSFIDEQEVLIEQLSNYIAGKYV